MAGVTKRGVALGAVVAVAAGGGAAWATTSSNQDPRKEFLNDVAKRLDVSPEKLTSALKGAYSEQLDQAVADGRLTKAQADALKQRLEKAGVPPGLGGAGLGGQGFGHRFGPGRGAPLGGTISAAASLLGLSEPALLTELRGGASLADVAKKHGTSKDDLVAALVSATKKRLEAAVDDTRITREQRDAIAKNLPARIEALVEGGPPARGSRRGPRGGHASDGDYRPVLAPSAGADL